MIATLSYQEQGRKKQIQIPYYEIQNVTQEIYEAAKKIDDFDFASFESQYTYFKPYLDYILLQKQGRLDSFLMNKNFSIYGNPDRTIFYYSKISSRLHKDTNVVPYLSCDDESIKLNQKNENYCAILLCDGNSISYEKAKNHELLIDCYLHHILSQNQEIAFHYQNWMKEKNDSYIFGSYGNYAALYLGVIFYIKFDYEPITYYTENDKVQTNQQTNWLNERNHSACYFFNMKTEEAEIAKQFIKFFS